MSQTDQFEGGPDPLREKRDLLAQLLQQGRSTQATQSSPAPQPAAPAMPQPRAQASTPAFAGAVPAREPVRHRPRPRVTRRRTSAPRRRVSTETGLFTHDQVATVAIVVVRLLALGVLCAGVFGSILAFDGNWQPSWRFWENINPLAVMFGLMFQGWFTLVEWWRGANWKDPIYLLHLAGDAVLTFVGYWPYIHTGLTTLFTTLMERVSDVPPTNGVVIWIVGAVFFVLCVMTARFPEMVFIKQPINE